MSAYSDAVTATSGLLAYWKLDEPSGTSAADSKGSFTGTYTNSPTLNVASYGGLVAGSAATFASASSQWVSVADSASLRGLSGLTIECWVKFTTLPGTDVLYTLVGKVGCYYLVFRDEAGTKKFQLSGNGVDTAVKVNWTPSTGTWYHVALTWQTGTNNTVVYVNGVSQGTGTMSSSMGSSTTTLEIGRFNGSNYLNGTLDEVALYNTALSGATVLSHYEAGAKASRTLTADAIISDPAQTRSITADGIIASRYTTTATADGLVEYGTQKLKRVIVGESATGNVRIFGATNGNAYRVYNSGGSVLESAVVSSGKAQFTSAVNGGAYIVGFTDNTYATRLEGQWWRGTVATGNVFDVNPAAIPNAGINPIATDGSYYYATSQFGSRGQIVQTATKQYIAYRTGGAGSAYGASDGSVVVARVDRSTGLIDQGPTTVRSGITDGHEVYLLQQAPSGKLRIITGGEFTHLTVRETTSADDITAWGSAVQITTAPTLPSSFAGTYMVDSNGNNHIVGSLYSGGDTYYGYAANASTTSGTWTWTKLVQGQSPWGCLFGDAVLQESGGVPYIHACWGMYSTSGGFGTATAYRYSYYLKLTGGSSPSAVKADGSSITLPITTNLTTGATTGDLVSSLYHYGTWHKITHVSGTPYILLDNDRNVASGSSTPGAQTVATWNGSSWSSNTISELIMWGNNPNTSDARDSRAIVNSNFGVNIQSRGNLVYVYGAVGNSTLQSDIDTGHTGFRLQRFKSSNGFSTYSIDNMVAEGYGAFTYTDLYDGGSKRGLGVGGAGFAYPKVPDDPATVLFSIVDKDYATVATSSLLVQDFTADGVISRAMRTFTTDGVVAFTRTFTADALVQNVIALTYTQTFTADARIVDPTTTRTVTTDAVVLSQATRTVSADAVIVASLTVTTTSRSLGADAVVISGGQASLTTRIGYWLSRRRSTMQKKSYFKLLNTGTPRTTSYSSGTLEADVEPGVVVFLDVTDASGTGGLTVRINAVDGASGQHIPLNTAPTAVTGTGQYTYAVYPFGAISGNLTQSTSGYLPTQFSISVAHGDASSYTYSLGYCLLP